jgi:hypothetical protein
MLGLAKEIYRQMRRASLRVIIREPKVGDANKREGAARVSVWVHTSGWFMEDLKASKMRRGGEKAFWLGTLAVSWAAVPGNTGFGAPLCAPADLVSGRSDPRFGGRGPQLVHNSLSA